MGDAEPLTYEARVQRINAAVERSLSERAEDRRIRRQRLTEYRPRAAAAALLRDETAEFVAHLHAWKHVFPKLREKPIIWLVCDYYGLKRSQVYDHLRKIDPEHWKQISEKEKAFAERWAEARQKSPYLNTIGRTPSL
jgi:hypothetical protein